MYITFNLMKSKKALSLISAGQNGRKNMLNGFPDNFRMDEDEVLNEFRRKQANFDLEEKQNEINNSRSLFIGALAGLAMAAVVGWFVLAPEYDGGSVEEVWEMAKYVVAFEKWVKDEKLGLIASHYDGFATGKAGVLDSMLIPAFSMLIKQGTACAVEGDMKVAMAMSILKTISGMGQLAEMYSIDFNDDIAIIGHSGSGDADISEKKPTMKIVKVFHGKTGGNHTGWGWAF